MGTSRLIEVPLDQMAQLRAERTQRAVRQAYDSIAKAGRLRLRDYVRLGWPQVEPVREFKMGWHIDAICLPGDAIIMTEFGERTIRDIVTLGVPVRVLSFNHATGQTEWKPVLKFMRSPGKQLRQTTLSGGRVLYSTGNHPVYVDGKGYVPAERLSVGDNCTVTTHSARDGEFASVRELQQTNVSPAITGRQVLQSEVLRRVATSIVRALSLSRLWQIERQARQALPWLHDQAQRDWAVSVLSSVRHAAVSASQLATRLWQTLWSVLQSDLLWSVGQGHQQPVFRPRHVLSNDALQRRVRTRASQSSEAGRSSLFVVSSQAQTGSSPHRPQPQQQYVGKLDNAVLGLSSKAASSEDVASVFQVGKSAVLRSQWTVWLPEEVFNLEVADNNNYFANGVLVHNCEHLEAVMSRQIIRLAIAMPPGCMKSLLACVFFPTYMWGPMGQADQRFIGFSHSIDLSMRDAVKSRRLIQTDWYQQLWGNRFALQGDQNTKSRYDNDRTGYRIADYVGVGTGERGDVVTIDDPHEVKDSLDFNVDAKALQKASFWLHETLPTRVNDPESSAIVCIHHRIHPKDMIGDILASDMSYELLKLPMEYDPANPCRTRIGWRDPRSQKDELLFPERFPRDVVERDKKAMTQFAVNGQFQQEPTSRQGNLIKRHWFEIVNAAPADCRWVRHFDLAATRGGGGPYTAGVLLGQSRSTKMLYVKDVKRVREDGDAVRKLISQTAAVDFMELGRANYTVSLPQDPGQAGKVQAKDFALQLAGYNLHIALESGDKLTRLQPFADQAEAGNVKLLAGPWNDAYLTELAAVPNGDTMDQVDGTSGAFGTLLLNLRGAIRVAAVTGHS